VVDTAFKRHEPLYLKYRPQSLAQLVGQDAVTRTLTNAIAHDRLSHAYLFTGPRGTGKTSSARILAKSLNCKTAGRPTAEPCQTCSCCVEITQGNSPAVFEIDAASNNSVDDARTLIERAPLKAVGGEFKVYIIDECHMLTKEAFNALLKTIEQPPPGVVFILATTEEHKVLPTIVSRCQRLMFKLINQDALIAHLRHVADSEEIAIEDDALKLIARRSGGGLRDALSNLDQASLLASKENPVNVPDLLRLLGALHEDVLLNLSKQVSAREGQDVINSVGQLLGEGREPAVVLQELSRHFLNLMKASYLQGSKEANVEALSNFVLGSEGYISGLLSQTELYERAELSQIIEQLDRLEQTCKRTSQPAMHLEIGLLSICHRHDIYLLKDLVKRVEALEQGISQNVDLSRQARPAQTASPQYAQQHSASQYAQPAQQSQARYPSASSPAPSSPPSSAPARSVDSVQSTTALDEPHARPPENQPSQRQEDLSISIVATGEEGAGASTSYGSGAVEPGTSEPTGASTSSSPHSGGGSELNSDIDYVWSQILDELQRRHLPTFSLASTHAFPLGVSNVDFTIGVLKENFQKMLESKAEHLRAAAQQVTGINLNIKVRVGDPGPASKKHIAPATRTQSDRDPNASPGARNPSSREAEPAARGSDSSRGESAGNSEDPPPGPSMGASDNEVDSSMMKEAYKLFEGPGSRRIT
jgi:DNA polymerase-3 subunit gamma/tau